MVEKNVNDDVRILKSAIANMVDQVVGSVGDSKRSVDEVVRAFGVSEKLAEVIIKATQETAKNKAWDLL